MTSGKDQPARDALLWTATPRPAPSRVRTPGEVIWTLYRGRARKVAELRPHPVGVELQILHNGDLELGQRYASPPLAHEAADGFRSDLLALGWSDGE